MRNILSIIVGLIVGIIIISLVELLGHLVYPVPAGVRNLAELKSYFAEAPAIIFIVVILGYALGSLAGGLVAALIRKKSKMSNALTVGGILMGLGLRNLIILSHPLWVTIIALAVFIPFAWLGGKLAVKINKTKTH